MTDLTSGEKRVWLQHPSLRIGAIASLVLLLVAFISLAWVPYPIESINVGAALQDPSGAHWLGTDHLGRDLISMAMKGMLTSFVVAAVAVAIGAIVGLPLGFAAATWGGGADWAILRVNEFLLVFPALIIAILITAVFGPSAVNVMVAVGVFNIPFFARAARDGVLSYNSLNYVDAARLAGMGSADIARRHILPAIAGLILVQAVSQLAVGILAEASLSYVGLGAQPPATSLGLMLRDAQAYALLKPALAIVPGLLLVLIVIALNLTGDGLRQQLDPSLRHLGGLRGSA
jgi:peptide/nickel transport system permease protein